MNTFITLSAALACGVLSGMGIGGGSILIVFMTCAAGMAQIEAQAVNLIYFIPSSLAALPSHLKSGSVDKSAALTCMIPGAVTAVLASFAASAMDTGLLRKFFGGFLIVVGLKMFFSKK